MQTEDALNEVALVINVHIEDLWSTDASVS